MIVADHFAVAIRGDHCCLLRACVQSSVLFVLQVPLNEVAEYSRSLVASLYQHKLVRSVVSSPQGGGSLPTVRGVLSLQVGNLLHLTPPNQTRTDTDKQARDRLHVSSGENQLSSIEVLGAGEFPWAGWIRRAVKSKLKTFQLHLKPPPPPQFKNTFVQQTGGKNGRFPFGLGHQGGTRVENADMTRRVLPPFRTLLKGLGNN